MGNFLLGLVVGLVVMFMWVCQDGKNRVFHYNNDIKERKAYKLDVWFKSPDEITSWIITEMYDPVISNYRIDYEKNGLYHLSDYIILNSPITSNYIKEIINLSLDNVETFRTGDTEKP